MSLHPRADADRRDLERILKHKATLLKQVGGRLGGDAAFTLDVWNVKLAEVGERIGRTRAELVAALGPEVGRGLRRPGRRRSAAEVEVRYEPAWRATGLAEALAAAKADEVRRQVCLVGPHRDDLELRLNGLPARTHASQGEQRTLALALRLAAHRLVAERVGRSSGAGPRRRVLRARPRPQRGAPRHLPPGQVLLTTAGPLPPARRSSAPSAWSTAG